MDIVLRGSTLRAVYGVSVPWLLGMAALLVAGVASLDLNGILFLSILFLLGIAAGLRVVFLRLSIHDGILRYSGLARSTIEIPLSSIREIRIEVGEERYLDRFRPGARLKVVVVPGVMGRDFDIDLTVFRREDSLALQQLLIEQGLLKE